MYICDSCHQVFNEPYVEYDDPSPKGVALPKGYYAYEYCPYCHSDRFSRIYEDEIDEDGEIELENGEFVYVG